MPYHDVSETLENWWGEPSDTPFAKGMTKGEEITDWLERHDVPQEDGKYVFYHATPEQGGATAYIRKGSYLAEDEETARHQAARDRGLKSNEIRVHKILLNPWDINIGVWATLRRDYNLS